MELQQFFIGLLFIAIALVIFYASVIKPELSMAPKFTLFLSLVFGALGVCCWVRIEWAVAFIGICVYLMMLAFALSGVIKPFIYRRTIRATYKERKDNVPVYSRRGSVYSRVYMDYEYDGESYHNFSQNTVEYRDKKFRPGENYKIYVNPGHPANFVTGIWASFFGCTFLLFFLVAMGIGTWMQYFG